MSARIKMQKNVKKLSGYSYFLYICLVEVVFFLMVIVLEG